MKDMSDNAIREMVRNSGLSLGFKIRGLKVVPVSLTDFRKTFERLRNIQGGVLKEDKKQPKQENFFYSGPPKKHHRKKNKGWR